MDTDGTKDTELNNGEQNKWSNGKKQREELDMNAMGGEDME